MANVWGAIVLLLLCVLSCYGLPFYPSRLGNYRFKKSQEGISVSLYFMMKLQEYLLGGIATERYGDFGNLIGNYIGERAHPIKSEIPPSGSVSAKFMRTDEYYDADRDSKVADWLDAKSYRSLPYSDDIEYGYNTESLLLPSSTDGTESVEFNAAFSNVRSGMIGTELVGLLSDIVVQFHQAHTIERAEEMPVLDVHFAALLQAIGTAYEQKVSSKVELAEDFWQVMARATGWAVYKRCKERENVPFLVKSAYGTQDCENSGKRLIQAPRIRNPGTFGFVAFALE